MATVNPKFIKPAPVRFSSVATITDMDSTPGTVALVGESLCLMADTGVAQFAMGSFVERPVIVGGEVAVDGESIALTFSQDVSGSDLSCFKVIVNGGVAEVVTATVDGDSPETVTVTLAEPIYTDDQVQVTYNGTQLYSAGGELLVKTFSVAPANMSEIVPDPEE